MIQQTKELPWILFMLQDDVYGISCKSVDSIIILSQVRSIADAPDYIRGVIDIRGKIITCIDLRMLLGLKSLDNEITEFQKMLEQREADHIHWLNELKNSVDQKKTFTLTTDPHACAFGKWYDNFKTDSVIFGGLLKKFDEPHKKIHSIAIEVKKLEAEEGFDKAKKLIEQTEAGELNFLIELFNKTKAAYRESWREVAIIIEIGQALYGFITDNVISVEHIAQSNISKIKDQLLNRDLSLRVGIRGKDKSKVILLDEEKLVKI